MKEDNKRQKIYKVIMLIILTAFITFMVTSLSLYTHYSKNPITLSASKASDITSRFSKIRNMIDKYYLWNKEIDEHALEDGAIAGYVEGLGDKYTEYISKDEMKEFNENITGSYVGIGVFMIADEEKGAVVYCPISESPAEEAGIKAGDIIKKVDDVEYGYEDFKVIADYIKGEEGTNVKITVERDNEELEFNIKRRKINTNLITTEILDKNIGYIRLLSFDSDTANHFKEKVEDLIKNGATSLIIDLRNNGGGIVDESTKIADFFIEKDKKIITTKDKDGKEEITKSLEKPIFDMPVIVLANENSASASEILIGALKDNGRAKIVGTKTYGKGVIQTVITLSDGSGLKITTAEYFTPNGTAIHKIGIEPDIEVKLSDDVKNIYSVKKENDLQLKRAEEELKNK